MLNKIIKELIGGSFGDNPVDELDKILYEKKIYTQDAVDYLGLNSNDVVLDLGAGLGWSGHTIAPLVHKYIYTDINQRFLDGARAELFSYDNADFYKLEPGNLDPVKHLNINKIICLSVFTQFNLYEAIIHLQEIYAFMKAGDVFYFDYKNYKFLEVSVDRHFKRHLEMYRVASDDSKLIKWHDSDFLEKTVNQMGFNVITHERSLKLSFLVLEKK